MEITSSYGPRPQGEHNSPARVNTTTSESHTLADWLKIGAGEGDNERGRAARRACRKLLQQGAYDRWMDRLAQ